MAIDKVLHSHQLERSVYPDIVKKNYLDRSANNAQDQGQAISSFIGKKSF
jgi:hypothetical protein